MDVLAQDGVQCGKRMSRHEVIKLLGKDLLDPQWRFLCKEGSAIPVAEYPVSKALATRQPLRDCVAGIQRTERENIAWMLVNADPKFDDEGNIARVLVSFAAQKMGRRKTGPGRGLLLRATPRAQRQWKWNMIYAKML